ncbi:hypothetical protein GM51_1805 [freshwater metagenome]|uniref:Uncharacterized protein n=1 Tax=freshwater metagenome TaxID=449393 RepID=A0A094SRZ4_9ZZZZ
MVEEVVVVVSMTGGVVVVVGNVVGGELVVVALRSYGILLGSMDDTSPLPGIEHPTKRRLIGKTVRARKVAVRFMCYPQGIQQRILRLP